MSTLFMIGNGFDLNCGMKTRYRDVYQGYIKTNSDSKSIEAFKKEISENIENWGDFECKMAEYAKIINTESEFITCVYDFSSFIREYLKKEEKNTLEIINDPKIRDVCTKEMLHSINMFYDGVSNNLNNLMYARNAGSIYNNRVISFNYTHVFDKLLLTLYKESTHTPNIIHIHGEIDDLVVGMDNEEQFDVQFPITNRLRRCFIKPVFNMQFDKARVENAMSSIDMADTICIFGMSLGISDLTWRNKLIAWMRSSEDRHVILYDFTLSKTSYKTISNRMDIEEDAVAKMLQKWGVDDDLDRLKDQFHIVCGKNLFNIKSSIDTVRKKQDLVERGKEKVDEILSKQ